MSTSIRNVKTRTRTQHFTLRGINSKDSVAKYLTVCQASGSWFSARASIFVWPCSGAEPLTGASYDVIDCFPLVDQVSRDRTRLWCQISRFTASLLLIVATDVTRSFLLPPPTFCVWSPRFDTATDAFFRGVSKTRLNTLQVAAKYPPLWSVCARRSRRGSGGFFVTAVPTQGKPACGGHGTCIAARTCEFLLGRQRAVL